MHVYPLSGEDMGLLLLHKLDQLQNNHIPGELTESGVQHEPLHCQDGLVGHTGRHTATVLYCMCTAKSL